MIKRLDWDSNFFGYPVGKIIVDDPQQISLSDLNEFCKGFRLVYLFSKEELSLCSDNLFPADKKVTLIRKTETLSDNYESIKPYYGMITDRLLELTFQSGIYSRFKADASFIGSEYRKLYTEWIENSVKRKIARDVFVYVRNSDIKGFITWDAQENQAGIGLIAVDQRMRGQGIGSMMIKYVVNEAFVAGYPAIKVVTQFDNKSAMYLYEKNGFQLCDLTYVYHYWNK